MPTGLRSSMGALAGDARMAGRLVRRLPTYLRQPTAPESRREIIRQRLERRSDEFLGLLQQAVFSDEASPYRRLLGHIGCEFGDLRDLVGRYGVEGALGKLQDHGVYLTLDEFKGRQPIARGSLRLEVSRDHFRNPLSVTHYHASTSGSGGVPTSIGLDLETVRERAVNLWAALAAWQAESCDMALWTVRGLTPLLWFSANGRPADRWFVQGASTDSDWRSKFWWAARIALWSSRLAGKSLPPPQAVDLNDPGPVLAWLAETLTDGRTPHLWCTPSSAVRLCQQARSDGAEVRGARFTVTGEPVTAARMAAIEGAGAFAAPDYGAAETGGSMAYGCRSPSAPDDVHLFSDLNAVIEAKPEPFPSGAMLVTTLRRNAPFVLLNVSLGDRAIMEVRDCGCPMERLGWRTHLRDIHSYEKLTAGGVTFEDGSIVGILEEVLPGRFGGAPIDYQLVEESGAGGEARLRLLVHPSVGQLDERAVAEVFLNALGSASETARDMARHLHSAGLLDVAREEPRTRGTGKIQHLVPADRREEVGAAVE